MRTEDLTVVETEGAPRRRAGQLGEAVRENYHATASLFEPRRALLETPQSRRVLANVRRRYCSECSDILPYVDAFSRGLGITRESLVEMNVLVALCKSRLDECSGFIITRGGRTVVSQNWDTTESAAPMAVLEIGRDPNGPDTVRFTSPLVLDFWSGINPYGLCKGGCSGPAGDPIGDGKGLTGTLWGGPLFYRCGSVADVRSLVENTPLPGKGMNSVFVDSHGTTLWTQQGGGRFAVAEPDTPYCVATGYRPGINQPVTPKDRAGRHRWQRFMDLGADAMNRSGDLLADVKAILADHQMTDGHPDSAPCRHGGPENSTQFSVITDVTNRTVHYCGRPCENEWRRKDLS